MKQIVIKGVPIPKARPRFARRGKRVVTYDSQKDAANYFSLMVREQWRQPPLDGPLLLACTFEMPRPKSHYVVGSNACKLKPSAPECHIKTPDCDNLLKFVKDCLNKIVWRDDCQVVSVYAEKHYSDDPKTIIRVEKAV